MLLRLFAITAAFGLALGTPAAASSRSADPLETQTRAIIARFDTALRACGVTPPYVPGVVIDSTPSLVSFYMDDRSVHLSRWAEMPAELQGMLGGLGGSRDPGPYARRPVRRDFQQLAGPP